MLVAARVDDLAELCGEEFGAGAAELVGDDGVPGAAAEPDEPDVSGGPAGAGVVVVELDGDRRAGVGVLAAVRGVAAGGAAVEAGPAARIAVYGVRAAWPGAAGRGRGGHVGMSTPFGPTVMV